MQVQYVVGLCCLRRNADAVDVTVGDMVLDSASEKERDVDVTVTLQDGPGVLRAFKAWEVKRERGPLDVADVEQLCTKLKDMPAVTHPAIVSASGYTDGAVKKAAEALDSQYSAPALSSKRNASSSLVKGLKRHRGIQFRPDLMNRPGAIFHCRIR